MLKNSFAVAAGDDGDAVAAVVGAAAVALVADAVVVAADDGSDAGGGADDMGTDFEIQDCSTDPKYSNFDQLHSIAAVTSVYGRTATSVKQVPWSYSNRADDDVVDGSLHYSENAQI